MEQEVTHAVNARSVVTKHKICVHHVRSLPVENVKNAASRTYIAKFVLMEWSNNTAYNSMILFL